jgi:DNA polymerase I
MLISFDFETEKIEDFPAYPPKPVGLSIYVKGQQARYYAFGHPIENNSTEEEARQALQEIFNNKNVAAVAYNLPFDLLVAHKHWGLPLKPECSLHDGMVMAFLLDPHAKELGLKPLAEKYLNMPPDERDEVKDWLVSNGICRDSKRKWGENISKAPGGLVGKYANGDTTRTLELFENMRPKIVASGMQDAYNRELSIQLVMLQNTVDGIPVNAQKLADHISMYDQAISSIDSRIYDILETEPFNIDSGEQLANAIDSKVPGIKWPKTATGKRSTSKVSMELALGSLQGELLACLQYRASVQTCVNTFMKEWHRQATHPDGDGKIHCQWHSTRSDDGGARTGRLSSSPNFQNIPTLKSAKFREALELWEKYLKEDYPPLPNVREYIAAPKGMAIAKRDFSGQELRVLAHYENGDLLQAYKANPNQDLHQWACDTIREQAGITITRKQAKTVAFAILYGSGLTTLAEQMGSDTEQARTIREAYFGAIPGIAKLDAQLKARAQSDKPIRTWGGRVYYVEPSRFDPKRGRWMDFGYKLMNVLIQGSSADLTKEALIAYDKCKVHGRLILCVHDELVLLVPPQHLATEMQILKNCMENLPLDAPLTSDGEVGTDYHNLEKYND